MKIDKTMGFEEDLKRGQIYEEKSKELLGYVWCLSSKNKGCFKDWDLQCYLGDGVFETYEVKADFSASRTGNFFIEFECSGRKSGIKSTKADYYMLWDANNNDCYKIKTETLKKLIRDETFRIVGGGDGDRAIGHLVKVSMLQEYKMGEVKN